MSDVANRDAEQTISDYTALGSECRRMAVQKLSGSADLLKDKKALQRILNQLDQRFEANCVKFNKAESCT